MLPLDHPFDVATGSERRPTPTQFAHLRKWAAPEEKFLLLKSTEEITNLNQQLDETDVFNVSNIFQRALSFIFGQTDLGPRIIKGTLDGALHVAIDGLLSDTKNLEYEPIDDALSGDNIVIAATAGQKIHVTTLVLTVRGAVDITLMSGANDISGPMDFGGENEPRGIVTPMGFAPIVCGTNEPFIINLSAAIQVSGFVTYYKQLA